MAQKASSQNMYDSIIKDRRIKVFLSSTFKDMSEERDYLARNVFMELEAEALKRNVALNLLDLRWGITAEESKQGLVTEICLKEIEASRPFFISIIGDRYGWIPSKEDFPENSSLFESFPWVKEDIKNGLSITEIEIQYGVLRNKLPLKAFFYIKGTSKDDTLDDSKEAKKLRHLKEQILAQKEHPVKFYKTVKELGEQIKLDIQQQMNLVFPKQEEMNALEESAYIQECILRTKTEHYIPIEGAFNYIDSFLISPNRLLVIKGDSGSGKSSLLANWMIHNKNRDYKVIYHFIDSSYYGNDYSFIIVRFYYKVCELLNIQPTVDWTHVRANEYVQELNNLLNKCNGNFVFVIDGLNQLDAGGDAYNLQWFPKLDSRTKIICSTNNDIYEITRALMNKSADIYYVPAFSDFLSLKAAIIDYLRPYRKALEDSQIEKIYNNKTFENPLLLFSLLEELRLWGIYEEFDERLDYYILNSDQNAFLERMFMRLEQDISLFTDNHIGEVFLLLSLSRNGIIDSDIADILDIPRVVVSSILYKCHRFISVYGGRSSISHSLITNYIKKRYDSYLECVQNKYKSYLTNKLSNAPREMFANIVHDMGYFYYHSSLNNELHALCTNPNAFIVFSIYGEIEDLTYWKHLFQNGYTMEDLLSRLNELPIDIKESAIPTILYRARGICANAHNNNELKRVIDFSNSYFKSCSNCNEEDRLWLYCHSLSYYIRLNNPEKALELSDIILTTTDSNPLYAEFRILAYQYKAQALLNIDFNQSVECLKKSAELSVMENSFESAIVAYINLGLFLAQRGQYDQALHYYTIARQLINKEIKNDSSLIIQKYNCLNNLSGLYNRIGDAENEKEYGHMARMCFLEIQNTPYSSRLSPEHRLMQLRTIGFNMMLDGKIEEGRNHMEQALEELEKLRADMSSDVCDKEKFLIKHDCAKGYAFNGKYVLAVEQLISYDKDICYSFNRNPCFFYELYFDHLSTLATITSDLGYHKASIYYYNDIIHKIEIVKKLRDLGRKTYVSDVWEKLSIQYIKEKCKAEAINSFDNAISGIIPYIEDDNSYLRLLAKYEIEKEQYLEYGLEMPTFDDEYLGNLYTKVKGKKSPLDTYIAVYLLDDFSKINKENASNVEDYIDTILNGDFFKYDDKTSKQHQAIIPYLAKCCDTLAVFYFDEREIEKSISYSKLSIACYEQNHSTKHFLYKLQALHHFANNLDTIGNKEQALQYYLMAIDECNNSELTGNDIVYMKSRILYDYGVALYGSDISKSEQILQEASQTAYSIYDEQTEVSIILADIQEALGNVYDDTNRIIEAENMYKSAIHVLSKYKDDPDFAYRLGKSYNNYGIMLIKQNRKDEAKKMLILSRDIRFDNDKSGLIRTDDILYKLALMEENYHDAYKYLKEILEIDREYHFLSNRFDEFVNYTDAFANACIRIGKIEEGQQAYKRVFDMVSFGGFLGGGYSDVQLKNITAVVVRVNELFGTTDFLKQ